VGSFPFLWNGARTCQKHPRKIVEMCAGYVYKWHNIIFPFFKLQSVADPGGEFGAAAASAKRL